MKKRPALLAAVIVFAVLALLCVSAYLGYEWYVRTDEAQNEQLNRWLSQYDERLLLPVSFSQQKGRAPLSDEEKQTYDAIVKAYYNHYNKIYVPTGDPERLKEIYTAVLCDYPGLFWEDGYQYAENGGGLDFYPTVLYSLEERQTWQTELEEAVQVVADMAAVFESEYDRAVFVHDYLVSTSKYDVSLKQDMIYDARGPLLNGLSVCAGYARAFMLVLQKLDIDCYYVTGEVVDGEGHAWNIARLDGVYTVIDVTYDDPSVEGEDSGLISHAYFGISSAEAAKTRISDDFGYPYPLAEDFNYFAVKGLYVSNVKNEAGKLAAALCSNIKNGDFTLEIRLASQSQFDKCVANYYPLGYIIESANKQLKTSGSPVRLLGQYSFISQDDLLVVTLITEDK